MAKNNRLASKLLKWYDKNARVLPWRIHPSKTESNRESNPYHTWLSEMMLQQTTVKVVKPYYELFILKWPTVIDLADAKEQEILEAWAGLGYYRRAHYLIECSKIIAQEYQGKFPQDEKSLLKLPGVGTYSAAAILCIGFNKRAIAIDGNIARIISRLFAIDKPISLASKLIRSYATDLVPSRRFGDYTQALMDLGSKICRPKNPTCNVCPINEHCKAHHQNLSRQIPSATPRKLKPTRHGYVFVTITNNNLILERRPQQGLLGGMLGFPTSKWESSEETKFCPPFETNWIFVNEVVSHTFTHFKLLLKIACARVQYEPEGYIIKPIENFDRESLPSLMRKVLDAGTKTLI